MKTFILYHGSIHAQKIDESGKTVKSIILSGRAREILLFLRLWGWASYNYSLYVDRKLIDTKQ